MIISAWPRVARGGGRLADLLVALLLATLASSARADAISACNEARQPAERIQGCTAIIEGDPPSEVRAIALMNRAIGLIASGARTAALADLDAALEADPGLVGAHYNRGTLHLDLGNVAAAVDDFDAVTDALPDFALGWLNRGLALEQAGDAAAAASDFAKALALDRSLTAAKRGLERVRRKH